MDATRETTRSSVADGGSAGTPPASVPAIVLAGDRQGSHPVFGRNKNLLKIGGEPSVTHVVRTLLEVEEVEAVYVVGPERELEGALASLAAAARPLQIVRQRETVVQNCSLGFRSSLTDARPAPDFEALKAEQPDAVALFLPGDLPLLNAQEVRHFVHHADMGRHDYLLGVTPQETIDRVVTEAEVPGLKKPSLHLAEGRLRQNNLHMIRPFAIRHLEYFDRFYNVRYQKEFWNSVKVALALIGASGGISRPLGYYLFAQAAMRAQLHGRTRWADWLRQRVPMDEVCAAMSRFMEARFGFLAGPCPGAALDIDSEQDLELTVTHLERLRAVVAAQWES